MFFYCCKKVLQVLTCLFCKDSPPKLMREKKPSISILVPCYNEEKTIRKCVLSWLNQTHPADEIIVVNDCSTDGTLKILEEFDADVL